MIDISIARVIGVSDIWIGKIALKSPFRHQLFIIYKVDCAASSDSETQLLVEGDVILTINKNLVTCLSDFDTMYTAKSLETLVVRSGVERTLCVPTIPARDLHTTHVLQFCGMTLHRPHHGVRQHSSKLHSEVYVNACEPGSPSELYNVSLINSITEVNSVSTPTLTAFLKEVQRIPDNEYFRLTIVDLGLLPQVVIIKKNEHYFPTVEFIKIDGAGWVRKTHFTRNRE